MKYITLKHLHIDGEKQIGFQYSFDKVIDALIKQVDGIQWSEEFSMYYVKNKKDNISYIFKLFKGIAWVNTKYFFPNKPVHQGASSLSVQSFRERKTIPGYRICPESFLQKLELRKYAYNTAKVYISCFESFINHYTDMEIDDLDEQNIKIYLQYLVNEEKSDSYINQSINSIKFYYEVVLGMPNRFYSIDRPKRTLHLPQVLDKSDVKRMINAIVNIKHKCIISLIYSSGLRRGELINLKISDVDSKRMMLLIRGAKGGKDRYSLLSSAALLDLRTYFKAHKPKEYLFEGPNGSPYSASSIRKILNMACKRVGIYKRVTPHILRYSFATYLLEDGVDLRYIQTLLGHNSSKTTEIYTHVAKHALKGIKSPLD